MRGPASPHPLKETLPLVELLEQVRFLPKNLATRELLLKLSTLMLTAGMLVSLVLLSRIQELLSKLDPSRIQELLSKLDLSRTQKLPSSRLDLYQDLSSHLPGSLELFITTIVLSILELLCRLGQLVSTSRAQELPSRLDPIRLLSSPLEPLMSPTKRTPK